ncbi:MAG: penicillin-binding protein 1C [Deltaproteobacteria bacterium]|nr:penicillin-binding protein 1C [Deltaproteobacteria bacterium]
MDRKDALGPRFPRAWRWTSRIVLAVNAALLLLLAAVYVVPLPSRAAGWSVVVEYRDGTPAYVFLAPDDKWRLPVDRVDPAYGRALVALEDKRFWSHHGVDPIAIARAAWSDLVSGRRVSGGSTLSMQLARLYEPRPRTIPSKLIDMFRAVQLDVRMSKHEILDEYLARTPFGENVEGVESAAWAYFGHSAQHLTPVEIATLLAVPQGPSRFAPSPANAERLKTRRDAILGKLIAAGVFSDADATAARADTSPVPTALRAMPRETPHAAFYLRLRYPGEARIRTTLDRGVTQLVTKQVALRATELRTKGIYNGAVVVADHQTREIVALVGSLDWSDARHGGQIPMFARPRSPGSTLKPLLYALAIDRGIALPEYLVPDVPSQYGTYRPKNFDGDWSGLVRLQDALARSLNQPFIDLLQQLGVEPFIAELQRLGVSPARAKPGDYGLSLIVGGIEVTPLELANIYATLAEGGLYMPLRLLARDRGTPQPIFGAGAAYLTRQALSQRDRPDFPNRRDVAVPPDIHWKTGTSFGFRDAWAVGSGPTYTAVVWTGNVDNRPSTDLVGSEAAGPLLFDVLESVDHTQLAEARPDDLVEVEVCAYSGHIPSAACTDRVKVLAPVHAVPTAPCPYHVTCDGKSYTVLPSAVTAWLTARNRALPETPPCTTEASPPQILTPVEGQVVTLLPGVPAKNQVVALSASTRATMLTWFVDGALIGTAPAAERLYWTPTPGKHDVVAADEAGRKTHRLLVVTQAGASADRSPH